MDYSGWRYGEEISADGIQAIVSGGARLCVALSLPELPSRTDFQRKIQSGVDPLPGLRAWLFSGVRLFRGGNDPHLRADDRGADSCVLAYAACARIGVAFRNYEIRVVDQLYFVVGGSVRASGVRAVALA